MTATVANRQSLGDRVVWSGGAATTLADIIIDTSGNDDSSGDSVGEISKYDHFTVFAEGNTVTVQGSHDGTNWAPIYMVNISSGSLTPVATSVDGDLMRFEGVFKHIRVVANAAITNCSMMASKRK